MKLSSVRMKPRLIGAFAIVAGLTIIVGWKGISSLVTARNLEDQIASVAMPSLDNARQLGENINDVRVSVRSMLIPDFTPAQREKELARFHGNMGDIAGARKAYEALPHSAEEQAAWNEMTPALDSWSSGVTREVEAGASGKLKEAHALAFGQALQDYARVNAGLTKIVEFNEKHVKDSKATFEQEVGSARVTMIIFCFGAAVVAMMFGFLIAMSVATPVKHLADAAEQLALGNVDVSIVADGQDEIADLSRSFAALAANMKDQAELVQQVAAGNLDVEAKPRTDKDVLGISVAKVISALRALAADAVMLSRAGVEGSLSTRADASKHQGEYRKIVDGVNGTLDAVIGPLNVAASYVDRIAKGDIPEKITESYNGDFDIIKANLNACVDGLAGLAEANAVLQRMALNDYESKVEGSYAGIFAEVATATNDVRTRVQHVIATLGDISKGDLHELGDYRAIGNGAGRRSERDHLVPAMIRMMETLGSMVADVEMLSQSAVAGRLETRADAARYAGEYRKVIEGVNDTLDAIVHPINEAAEVLHRVAERDLTARMEGDYAGDFSKIKDSLNTAVKDLDLSMQQVADAATQVGSAANEISQSSQSLAQGSSSQAAALEEIAASLQETGAMGEETAKNARQAKELADEASSSAGRGVKNMRGLSDAIDKIKASSDNTAKIVKTIDEIAFQTNLLALNAAVEAARAGDAGKGFAVVAEEVRNLAMRSADAAKRTADLIEESVHNAEAGVSINQEVLQNLEEIDAHSAKVTSVMAEIAEAATQQREALSQVNQAVDQVNQVTQEAAAGSEEAAAASEELLAQAEEMQSMVGSFVISSADALHLRKAA